MGLHITIPKELAHLRITEGGYPVPFFAPVFDGKPDFRLLDEQKQIKCVQKSLCSVCGLKLNKDYIYFLGGPKTLKNRVSTDPAMHRHCAEFSLAACPHLRYQKAQRRESDLALKSVLNSDLLALEKPDTMYLIKASKQDFFVHWEGPKMQRLIRIRYQSHETYRYVNGILQKEEAEKTGNG